MFGKNPNQKPITISFLITILFISGSLSYFESNLFLHFETIDIYLF